MPGLTIAGATALAGGLAALGTAGAAGISNAVNYGNSKIARHENYLYNEMAASNAYQRQLQYQRYLQQLQYKQYYDLESPKAIIQQLRDAGLSPSLYAAGNAGGNISGVAQAGTPPQGAGASGIGAPYMSMSPIDFAGIQLAMAQADKAHEEANALRGDNKKGAADIENVMADTAKKLAEKGLTEASECLAKANTLLTQIHTELESKTLQFNINKAYADSEKANTLAQTAVYECISASSNAQIDSSTVQERINTVKLQNNLLKADELIRKSNIRLNDARIDEINAEIKKWQAEITLQGGELATKVYDAKTKREFNKIIDDFYDSQVQNLEDRLQFDKNKFKKENVREWTRIVGTLVNDAQGNLLGLISDIIPSLK